MRSQTLAGKEWTGNEMRRMSREYWGDLGSYLSWPFSAWFDFVRILPYQSDNRRFPDRILEVVARPALLLDKNIFPRLDCKKKAILIGAWAEGNGFPYRFVAVSSRPDGEVHHVMPQINFGGGWINADATFPDFEIGQGHEITFAAELTQ